MVELLVNVEAEGHDQIQRDLKAELDALGNVAVRENLTTPPFFKPPALSAEPPETDVGHRHALAMRLPVRRVAVSAKLFA
jgi:hypothetical protein